MGRRGPPKQPTVLALVKGNPGKRAMNRAEPKAKGKLGAPPEWLDAIGKTTFRALVKLLGEMQVESASDRKALELLASTYAEFRAAKQRVAAEGLTISRKNMIGETMVLPHPCVAIAADAQRRMLRLLQEFGLTPSARSGVKAGGAGEQRDPMDEFLGESRKA